jgi:hypothetical protein
MQGATMTALGHINELGQYVKGKPQHLADDRNTMYKSWSHDQQRKEFGKEVLQPHIGGKINPEFVKNYPDYSHKYFNQAEIDAALRETP